MNYNDPEWLRQKYTSEGLTVRQIGEAVGVPSRTIHSWLVKWGIPRRSRGVDHWSKRQIQLRREFYKAHPLRNPMKGRRHSEETKLRMSLARRAANNANWRGGLTEMILGFRKSPAYYQWRRAVLKRDNYTCQECGGGHQRHAHHIRAVSEYPEGMLDIDNGITLCRECHKRHTLWSYLKPKRRKGKRTSTRQK